MSIHQSRKNIIRHLPSVSGLLAFEAAGHSLSFVHAARALNVTPGAISRQIQSLESYLGAALFVRRHKRVELTPLGRDYLADITTPLERITAATARIRDRASEGSNPGALSICAYPTFAIRWLIPRWSRFHDHRPDIDLRLTTTLNPVDFERDDYDLAILIAPKNGSTPGLVFQKLIDIDIFPVCSPKIAKSLRSIDDLRKHTMIHDGPRPTDWRRWLDSVGAENIDASQGLRFETLNMALHAAIEGIGVAIAVEALIGDELQQGRLVRPFANAAVPETRRSNSPFQIVYPESKAPNPNLTAFCDWMLDEAASGGVEQSQQSPT
ncbi:MAG: LysR family glycine cleavage system transcriptional activator [Alphaproteobacteria bacterium]